MWFYWELLLIQGDGEVDGFVAAADGQGAVRGGIVAVVAVLAVAALLLDYYYLGVAMAGTGLLLLLYFKIDSFRRRREISSYIQTATDTLETAAKGEMPFPMALIKLSTGEMVWGNDAFNTITEQKGGNATDLRSAISEL